MSHIAMAVRAYHVFAGAMDAFARGLRNAVKLVEDGVLKKHVQVSLDSREARAG